jgi:hypothetical protein
MHPAFVSITLSLLLVFIYPLLANRNGILFTLVVDDVDDTRRRRWTGDRTYRKMWIRFLKSRKYAKNNSNT